MRTPKRNGSGGDFLSGLSHRRQDEPVGAWRRKPLSHILRQQRESRKLSLQEGARLTGIPVKYLYLLEGAGEKRLLAGPLSLISSLRRYAVFLNLNPDLVVTQFIAELEKLPPVEEETGGGARPTQLLKPLPPPRVRVMPRTLLLLLALGLLAFLGSYSVLTRQPQPTEDKIVPLPSPSATPSAPAFAPPPPVSPPAYSASPPEAVQSQPSALPPAVSPPVAATPQAEPSVAPASRVESPGRALHRLRVQAKAKTWLHVALDGQPMKRLFLHPGQSVEWSAEKGFTLSLGNAGGVQLTLDGQALPPLGKAGQMVHNVRLPSQGGSQERQVRSTEHPLAAKPRPPRR